MTNSVASNDAAALARTRDAARPRWRSPAVIGAAGVLAILILLPMLAPGKFAVSLATSVIIQAIAAASLHLLIRVGHVSLGHGAFMGVGAYAAVLLAINAGWSFPFAVAAAFVLPATLALAIGPLILRVTGKYFVLVTFLLGEIVRLGFVEATSITGGSNGIFGIPPVGPMFQTVTSFYYLALGFGVVCIGFIALLLRSEFGRAVDAIREGEQLAECSGVPVVRFKVAVFALSCGIAGVAGALLAFFVRYIDPMSFSIVQSINLVVINVLGGMGSLAGVLLGTVFFVILPEFLRGYVELQRMIFGLALIGVMAFMPGGLAAGIVRLRGLFWSRTGGGR